MAHLPTPLSIAWWLTGSLWPVGLLAHVAGLPGAIVVAAAAAGLMAGLAEWLLRRGERR